MNRSIPCFCLALGFLLTPGLRAQNCVEYRIVYKTILEEERVTTYRLEYETEFRDQTVTTMRPEWTSETRQRTYQVAKPVTETSTRNERYTVRRPVIETETRYQQHTVRRPVCETVSQDRNYLVNEPVTTMRTEVVDRGQFVDQQIVTPGAVRNQLQWLSGAYFVDPRTGTQVYHRGGFHWVPTQQPSQVTVMRQYVPNLVEQQVAQTSYVQKVVTEKVPVQVTRYVDEVISEPVQVQVQKWVTEEIVRPVTVQTQRIEYEERTEPYEVRTCRMVPETKTVSVPYTVAKWAPYQMNRTVPRTVAMRVPVDPCTGQIVATYPLTPLPQAETTVKKPEVKNEPTPAVGENSVLKTEQPTPAAAEPKDSDPVAPPVLEKIPDLNPATGAADGKNA